MRLARSPAPRNSATDISRTAKAAATVSASRALATAVRRKRPPFTAGGYPADFRRRPARRLRMAPADSDVFGRKPIAGLSAIRSA